MNRAVSTTPRCFACAICRASGWYAGGPTRSQSRATSVCCGERFALALAPSSLISLYELAHSLLVNGTGATGRNCEALVSANGFIADQLEPTAGAVGTYTPARVCGRYASGASAPSPARAASSLSAIALPIATP